MAGANTSYTRTVLKHCVASAIRMGLLPLISRITFRGREDGGAISVHTLVHAGNWRLGLLALSSFILQTGRRWKVFIHEDGSLADRVRRIIRRDHPEWILVTRTDADARVHSALKQYPCLLERRAENNLMVKFVDPCLFAPYERYLFIDPDVFFFAPPVELMKWIADEESGECWFMKEYEEVYAYSFSLEQLHALNGAEVKAGVNTGLCLLDKQAISFEQSEQFLEKIRGVDLVGKAAWYIEQTLLAIVATRSPGGLLPETYITGYDAGVREKRKHRVACHYVGPTKNDRLYYDGVLRLAGIFTKKGWLCGRMPIADRVVTPG